MPCFRQPLNAVYLVMVIPICACFLNTLLVISLWIVMRRKYWLKYFFPLADGNGFVKVNDKLPVDGSIIDKDTICVFPGMFRAFSAMDGNMMRPILLATSNGCSIDTKNFKEVTRTKKYVPIYTLDKKYWSHSGLVNFLYLCKPDVTVTRLPGGHSSLENCSGAKYKIFT